MKRESDRVGLYRGFKGGSMGFNQGFKKGSNGVLTGVTGGLKNLEWERGFKGELKRGLATPRSTLF